MTAKLVSQKIVDIDVEKLSNHHTIKTLKNSYFSADQVNQISREFRFLKAFDLEKMLESAALFYFADKNNLASNSDNEERELLQSALETGKLLRSILARFGAPELLRIGMTREYIDWNGAAVTEELRKMNRMLSAGAAAVPPAKKKGNVSERYLVGTLANIFEVGTGRRAGYSKAACESFSGAFCDFCEAVLPILEIKTVKNNYIAEVVKSRNKSPA